MFIQFDLGTLISLGLAHFRSLCEIPFRQGWVDLFMLLQGLVFTAGHKYPLAFFLSGGIFFLVLGMSREVFPPLQGSEEGLENWHGFFFICQNPIMRHHLILKFIDTIS